MSDREVYFQILGVEPSASYEEVRKCYRQLVKEWHPDRFFLEPELQQVAHRRLSDINGAYEALSLWFDQATAADRSAGTAADRSRAPERGRKAGPAPEAGGSRRSGPARKWYEEPDASGCSPADDDAWSAEEARGRRSSGPGAESIWRYQQAAEQGFDSAQFELGMLYFHGRGVARDLVEAFKWLSLAAAPKGRVSLMAEHYLARLHASLNRAQIVEAQRRMAPFRSRAA